MRRRSAFTLVELLVVIGIIALLMGILIPSLSKAQKSARRLKCAAALKQYGGAQMMYIGEQRGWCVPIKSAHDPKLVGQYGTVGYIRWDMNEVFRKHLIMGIPKDVTKTTSWAEKWPEGLLCPEAMNALDKNDKYVMNSYGFNREGINRDTNGDKTANFNDAIAFKWNEVQRPSEKVAVLDANYWLTAGGQHGSTSDYKVHWDLKGENLLAPNGQVMYRHQQGANVLYYDGHVDWVRKQDLHTPDEAVNARHWNLLLN
jgi:prepilin-type processing-associated H-X9-DG protein/prepilin-type N-terminal cleavage/methylation domain-containing protein